MDPAERLNLIKYRVQELRQQGLIGNIKCLEVPEAPEAANESEMYRGYRSQDRITQAIAPLELLEQIRCRGVIRIEAIF